MCNYTAVFSKGQNKKYKLIQDMKAWYFVFVKAQEIFQMDPREGTNGLGPS